MAKIKINNSFLKDKKLLIIAPHPDDEAICNGGLIALAKKEGSLVYVLYMSIGESRQFLTKKTDPRERLAESKKAALTGNFKYEVAFTGKPFMRLDSMPQKDLIEKIEDVSENFKPNIVVIPFRYSFDQDHRAAATACITTFRPIPRNLRHQPNMIIESEEPYTWTTQDHFSPNVFFDISNVFDEKIKLLKCHKTQIRKDPFSRSPDNLRRLAGIRGCNAGVQYAEAYNLLKLIP